MVESRAARKEPSQAPDMVRRRVEVVGSIEVSPSSGASRSSCPASLASVGWPLERRGLVSVGGAGLGGGGEDIEGGVERRRDEEAASGVSIDQSYVSVVERVVKLSQARVVLSKSSELKAFPPTTWVATPRTLFLPELTCGWPF